jgi:hypothetical protein
MRLVAWLLLPLLAAAGASRAQMPSTEEMVRATASVSPLAQREGVTLRIGTLWLAALRERAPMLAAFGRGVCQLGYSAYTPGRDYRWLFPTLTPPQRETWLVGLVHHELAHCLEQADPTAPPAATQAVTEGAAGQRWHEVLADLAFALHVDGHSPQGEALVRQFAALRAAQHDADPVHDSSAELLCYLRLRGAAAQTAPDASLAKLQQWRARCWQGGKEITAAAPTLVAH